MKTLEYLFTPHGHRRLKWEALGRLHRLIAFTYDGDLIIWSPRQNRSAREAFIHGYDNREVLGWLDGYLKPGMTCFDVGANVGLYGLYMAKRVGPMGRVFAFEADLDTAAILEKNRAANNMQNLLTTVAAVGETEGSMKFQPVKKNRGASHIASSSEAGTKEVRVVTLDGFCREAGIESVDYVKLDVEGYEVFALSAFQATLAMSPNAVVHTEIIQRHLARYEKTTEDLRAQLEPLGFRAHEVREGRLEAYDFSRRSGDAIWMPNR